MLIDSRRTLLGFFLLYFIRHGLFNFVLIALYFFRLAEKIEKANEITKVKKDTAVLKEQCELYLKEKEEAITSAKNLEESFEKRISDLQDEIKLKDNELDACHQQINADKENIRGYRIVVESLEKEFKLLDSAIFGNLSMPLFLLNQFILCLASNF